MKTLKKTIRTKKSSRTKQCVKILAQHQKPTLSRRPEIFSILVVTGMIFTFSLFSVVHAQSLLTREAPKCEGFVACTQLFFGSIWATLTGNPISSSYAQFGGDVVSGTPEVFVPIPPPPSAPNPENQGATGVVTSTTDVKELTVEEIYDYQATPAGTTPQGPIRQNLILQPNNNGAVGIGGVPNEKYKLDVTDARGIHAERYEGSFMTLSGTAQVGTLTSMGSISTPMLCLGSSSISCPTNVEDFGPWKKVSGGNDLYYDAGNVGIGSKNTPSHPLEVVGIGGRVDIGVGATTNKNVLLDMTSTTQGFLPPRMPNDLTIAQADANKNIGLTIYNTTDKEYKVFNGTTWNTMGGGWKKVEGGLAILGDATANPTERDSFGNLLCPTGYDWYDENKNDTKDNSECKRTNLIVRNDGRVGFGTKDGISTLGIRGIASYSVSGTPVFSQTANTTLIRATASELLKMGVGDKVTAAGANYTVIGFGIENTGDKVAVVTPPFPTELLSKPATLTVLPSLLRVATAENKSKLLISPEGNVGIGTTTPKAPLHIVGAEKFGVAIGGGGSGGNTIDAMKDGSGAQLFLNSIANNDVIMVPNGGNVGIGTASPTHGMLEVNGTITSAKLSDGTNAGSVNLQNLTNNKVWHMTMRSGDSDKLQIYHHDGTSWRFPSYFTIDTQGNVGIGTATPGYKLDVKGDINVFAMGQDSLATKDNKRKLALAKERIGFDVAELFESEEDVEVGDVVVTSNKERKIRKSSRAYQGQIIGVVSGSPALLFEGAEMKIGSRPDRFTKGLKPPIALVGRVPIRITTENGAIQIGDYLTTSSVSGVAMKATLPGPIIGIALEEYSSKSEGKILAFININQSNTEEYVLELKKRLDILEKKFKQIKK